MSSPARGPARASRSATCAGGHARLRAVEAPAVARRGSAVVGGSRGVGAELGERRGEHGVAGDDAGQQAAPLLVGAELGDRRCAAGTSVVQHGTGATVRPTAPAGQAGLEEAEARARRPSSGSAMPSRSALASSAHVSRSNQSSLSSSSAQALRASMRSVEDLAGQVAQLACCSSVRVKSIVVLLVSAALSGASRACPGRRSRSGRAASRWCRRRR